MMQEETTAVSQHEAGLRRGLSMVLLSPTLCLISKERCIGYDLPEKLGMSGFFRDDGTNHMDEYTPLKGEVVSCNNKFKVNHFGHRRELLAQTWNSF